MDSFIESHTSDPDFRCTPPQSMSYAAAPLRDLPADTCRWPYGDLHDPHFRWCGEPTDGCSYCETHQRAARDPEQHGPRITWAWMTRSGRRR